MIHGGKKTELYCRDILRSARAAVLRDAEALPEMLFALERVGTLITGKSGLQGYRKKLAELGRRSPLAEQVPDRHRALHVTFRTLYDLVHAARNEAMHQGAWARHLAQHAIELSLILEDAFMNRSDRISDYMVKSPVCAEPWEPVSLIRQQMLTNSFSFLPVLVDDCWKLVSDCALAKLLRGAPNDGERAERLKASLEDAIKRFGLGLPEPIIAGPGDSVSKLVFKMEGPPIIVIENKRLLGIATPYDLL